MADPGPDGSSAPDGLALLEEEHRRAEALLSRLERDLEAAPRPLLDEAVHELSVHSAIEIERLYPLVARSLEDGSNLAKQARLEHENLEMTMVRLLQVPLSLEEFRDELRALVAGVRDHVRFEESTLFPQLRQAAPASDLEHLAGHLRSARRLAPVRPHPHALKSALGSRLGDRVLAAFDRVRERVRQAG